jgi:peptide/nickel transport system substrate-binding protein
VPSRQVAPILFVGLIAIAACGPQTPAVQTALPAAKPTTAAVTSQTPAPTALAQSTPGAPVQQPTVTASTQAPVAGAATPAPKRGGTLVIAASADPGQFNPAISTAGGTHFVADNLYNGLIFLDEQLTPHPDLADSWDVSPDGKTYTFHLHPGVKWQDGQPFSSDDVKFSFEQVLLKYHARTKSGLEGVLDGVDTPDQTTVVLRFKQPYGPLLQRLDVVEAPIVAKHIYEGQDPTNADANLKPVGTGPYKLAEYVKGDHVKLVRNDSYFKPGLPYLDEVDFRIIPQASTAVAALEAGEVDYVQGVPGPDLVRVKANPAIKLGQTGAGSGGSFCADTMFFNLSRTPLDKPEVRQAFAYGMDRDQILHEVYFDQGRVAKSAISADIAWATNPNVQQYAHDAGKANQLLDQAGLPRGADGMRFTSTFVHATSYAKYGELMKQQLAEVGININLMPLEVNAANEQNYIKKDFDLGFASYCNGPDPEIGVRRMYVSNNIGPILFSNGASYKNPQVDQLFDQAASAVERAERARAYAQFQDIVAKDLPYLPIVETLGYRAWRSSVHDLHIWSGEFTDAAWMDAR